MTIVDRDRQTGRTQRMLEQVADEIDRGVMRIGVVGVSQMQAEQLLDRLVILLVERGFHSTRQAPMRFIVNNTAVLGFSAQFPQALRGQRMSVHVDHYVYESMRRTPKYWDLIEIVKDCERK